MVWQTLEFLCPLSRLVGDSHSDSPILISRKSLAFRLRAACASQALHFKLPTKPAIHIKSERTGNQIRPLPHSGLFWRVSQNTIGNTIGFPIEPVSNQFDVDVIEQVVTRKVRTVNVRCLSIASSILAVSLLTGLLEPAKILAQPVKVYILSGQSNMVGIGQVTGGGSRWGSEFIDPVLSVYAGEYSADKDYDQLTPTQTVKLTSFGGVKPTPYPGGGTQIVRGLIEVKKTGVYELRPGYGGSTYNFMEVNGTEVYRREPGSDASHTHIKLTAGQKASFKITYLTDQANGLGWIARVDIPGTLATVVKQDGKFPYLVDDQGKWIQRKDVLYRGVVTATGNRPLSVGCGAGGNNIGPELGFGWVVGDFHDEPVLILKASQGNRSLGWDYLPPGSERFEHDGYIYAGYKDSPGRWEQGSQPEPINWYAGKQYDDCFGAAKEVLKNFDKEFPHWKGRGFEIAGFVWWQGHKDGGEPYASRYEQNLVHLIKTLRKDFDAPTAPFVIGTIGFDGWEMAGPHKIVADAQLAVSGEQGKYPEFKGNVLTAETRDFWRTPDESPKNQGFHYNQNAETYMNVGESLGSRHAATRKAQWLIQTRRLSIAGPESRNT